MPGEITPSGLTVLLTFNQWIRDDRHTFSNYIHTMAQRFDRALTLEWKLGSLPSYPQNLFRNVNM